MPKKSVVAKRARQDLFISELLRNGHSQKAAQEKLGIAKATVALWKRDPEFMARLNERKDAITGTGDDKIRSIVERALRTLEESDDVRAAIVLLEAYDPERFDPRVRSKVWETKRLSEGDQQPPQTIFRRGPEPERLRIVKKEDATGTDP